MSLATQISAMATRVGVEIKSVRAAKQEVVRWSGTAWPARPTGLPFGVLFLSTNDVNATAPTGAITGDVWKRHPSAV